MENILAIYTKTFCIKTVFSCFDLFGVEIQLDYLNKIYKSLIVSVEVQKEVREFSIAVTSVADSFGITLAGFTSIPVHNAICDLGIK